TSVSTVIATSVSESTSPFGPSLVQETEKLSESPAVAVLSNDMGRTAPAPMFASIESIVIPLWRRAQDTSMLLPPLFVPCILARTTYFPTPTVRGPTAEVAEFCGSDTPSSTARNAVVVPAGPVEPVGPGIPWGPLGPGLPVDP